jgi:hypothetical protein
MSMGISIIKDHSFFFLPYLFIHSSIKVSCLRRLRKVLDGAVKI